MALRQLPRSYADESPLAVNPALTGCLGEGAETGADYGCYGERRTGDEYQTRMCDKGIFFGVPVKFVGSFPDRGRFARGLILRRR